MLRVPTLFWFGISDNALAILAWVGLALSLVVLGRLRQRHPARSPVGDLHVDRPRRPDLVRLRLGDSTARDRFSGDFSLPAARSDALSETPAATARVSGFFAGSAFAS